MGRGGSDFMSRHESPVRVDGNRRAVLTIAGIAVGGLLAGCAVGPDYKRPELVAPEQHRGVEGPASEASLADLPWWELFEDTELQTLIRESIAANLDLRTAAARVVEARARAGVVKSFLYPEFGFAAGFDTGQRSRLDDSNEIGSTDRRYENFDAGFTLAWEIDLFGRIRRESEAAFALYLATEESRRGVLITLVADVASSWFLLRELDLELEIAHRTLVLNDETVAFYDKRLRGGVSNKLEVDQAIANRARTASTIPDLERLIAITENSMSVLLGRLPGSIVRSGAPASLLVPPAVPAGLPVTLLERRPDVLRAEQLLVAANADIGAAKALFFPTLSLTGFLGGVHGAPTSPLGGGGAVWSLTPSLLQPIFNAGRLKQNVQVMQARFDTAIVEYRKSALNGYREVANALVTIQKLAEIREQQRIGVEALTDAADLSRARYDSGLASYLEILTADQELFTRQLLLAQTLGAELRARAELYRTLGGGWQTTTQP